MNEQSRQRLSDTRGNKKGVEFFRFWYKVWGYTHTKVMIWFVTFFYMLFDTEARRRVAPYIRHRFPNAGFLARCRHAWCIFAHQGMCLLRQEMYEEIGEEYEETYDSALAEKIRFSDRAAVLLYSHFGPWQVMMRSIGKHKNTVNIVAQPDLNRNVNKMKSFSGKNDTDCIRQVSPESGSLLFLQQALENDEFVTMMGDRNFEKNPLPVKFLGETAYFPIAAFHLAARMKCPLVCIFAHLQDDKYVLEFCEAMYPEQNGRNREHLRTYLEKYTGKLEKLCMEYPYDFFAMFDHWSCEQNEK